MLECIAVLADCDIDSEVIKANGSFEQKPGQFVIMDEVDNLIVDKLLVQKVPKKYKQQHESYIFGLTATFN